MTESLFSTYWYRVANLTPVLRDAAVIFRHVYRGQPWYVIRNSLAGRNHRFNAAAYALIGRMDGRLTVQEIWEEVGERQGQAAPTQDELIRLLGQLSDADLIQSDILPSTVEVARQLRGVSAGGLKRPAVNPFSQRFELFDPDRLLERWRFLAAPLFTRGAFLLWLSIVIAASVAAALNWTELVGSLADQPLTTRNMLLLWLIYPVIKLLHEAGHAFAVKRWGGEVHATGIMLIAMTPIPFVDATASSAFPEKSRRIAVAAMGMMVELLLASLALFVWLNVETGLVSAVAYNVMLIGGVSTVLFNGNPLLRYDGYYMLADLVEIPNLGQRSTRYLAYLVQRYLLAIETAKSPVTAAGEAGWFLVYGPISFCYRIVVLVGLIWLVSDRFFFAGVLIALWGTVSILILPAAAGLSRLLANPAVRYRRFRLLAVGGAAALGSSLMLFVFPMPLWTTTEGVVWLPEQSVVRSGTDCEISSLLVPVEAAVVRGTPLVGGSDPFLEAEIGVFKARLDELYASYGAVPFQDRVERKMLQEEIGLARGDLKDAEGKLEKLLVRSPASGNFIPVDARNLPGRFVKKGEVLGYIIADHRPTVRVVVRQADIALVQERLTGVTVLLAGQPATPWPADVKRIVPAADLNLPSAALGTGGGGNIPVDPTDPEMLRALTAVFQVDIILPEAVENAHVGGRVHVRFEHGTMPLALQWYRSLSQLFLRKFNV